MRWFLPLLLLLCTARAFAQSDAGTPELQPEEPTLEGETFQFREPGAEFRWQAPAPEGACIGGNCEVIPIPKVRPEPSPPRPDRSGATRMRFAYTGALLGTVSAGLVLGSSIAIAAVDDHGSERITRGVWLGYVTLSTGVVALSSHLARRSLGGGSSQSGKALRTIGWTAFVLTVVDGAILWAGAFQAFAELDPLTIGAGVIGACALLPHALDAYIAGRSLRSRQFVRFEPALTGLRLRF